MNNDIKSKIRDAGGIVHGDGNIFFTNSEQFNAAARAALAPVVAEPVGAPVVDDGTEGSSFVDLHREEIAKLGEKAGIAPVSSFAFARAVLKLATATEQDAKDTERLDYLLNNRSYVVSDETCCDGYWLLYVEPGGTWVQASEHSTPREAIDAAIAASKGGDK